jgi:hypothetical protein
MTAITLNKVLAGQAKAIMQVSDGLAKAAARCVLVACDYSPSIQVARDLLGDLAQPDLRAAATELLNRLAAEAGRPDVIRAIHQDVTQGAQGRRMP